ncbi:hypothetical protein ACIS_00734 [Anaplasma centrale str. Israel]|uniref:DUF3168 domain-containing protein n=1 Tax=Anaplasma centrale (strain Israel) TaxID=574556 RepID=D1AUR4_ANACI|nr:DUF3168 domain-containing protein [Anaplasma centrale]ACZ49292.1 hypothetical protein ACIS_00734 [Anaplasma centrale str. Israel]
MSIADLYALALERLRSDHNVRNLVSSVYEQAPTVASVPYANLHIRNSEDITTFDRAACKVHMTCYIFSYSIIETIEIIKHAKNVLQRLLQELELTFIGRGYRVVQKGETFQSALSFEVLIDDSPKIRE